MISQEISCYIWLLLIKQSRCIDKISILFYTCTNTLDGKHVLISSGLQLYGIWYLYRYFVIVIAIAMFSYTRLASQLERSGQHCLS